MKKSTEELILSEIILLKTEVMRTNSRLGYLEEDVKETKEKVNVIEMDMRETKEKVFELEQEMKEGFSLLSNDIKAINFMMETAGEYTLDHEKRIVVLEKVAA